MSAFITDNARMFCAGVILFAIISSNIAVSHDERPVFTEGGIHSLISYIVSFSRESVYLIHTRKHNMVHVAKVERFLSSTVIANRIYIYIIGVLERR